VNNDLKVLFSIIQFASIEVVQSISNHGTNSGFI